MPYEVEAPSAFDYEMITVDSTAGGVSLTNAAYQPVNAPGAVRAFLTVEGASLRYQYHPSAAPTATAGHLANAGDVIVLECYENIKNFRAIRTGETNATIYASYER